MVIPQIGLSAAFICLRSFADQHVSLKQPVLKRKWGAITPIWLFTYWE